MNVGANLSINSARATWRAPLAGSAILLIGGDKTGDDRFYERMIPVADELYDVHLKELKQEGLLK